MSSPNNTPASSRVREKLLRGEPVHFKPDDPEKARTIPAQWITDAVIKGAQINVQHAIISGPFNLQYAIIEKEFALVACDILEVANFSYSTFKQNLLLSGTTFHHGAYFKSARLEYDAFLNGARFLGGDTVFLDLHCAGVFSAQHVHFEHVSTTNFNRASFKKDAFFSGTTFENEVNFGSSHFQGQAIFSGVVFRKAVTFNGVRIEQGAFFRPDPTQNLPAVRFDSDADFTNAQISANADFDESSFKGRTSFMGARFGAVAGFRKTRFEGQGKEIIFDRAVVEGSIYFERASFAGLARFSGMQVAGQAAFQGTVFKHDVSFHRTQIKESAFFRDEQTLGITPAVFEGAADFARVQIGSQAAFQGVQFKSVDKTVSFDGAQIGSNAFFLKTYFAGTVRFHGTRIGGQLYLQGATFKQAVSFDGAMIAGRALLRSEPTQGLPSTSFEGVAIFVDTTVGLSFELEGVVFRQPVFFERAQIRGSAIFHSTEFLEGSIPSFRGVWFQQGAFFQRATFHDAVDFTAVRFDGEARFHGTRFSKKANFSSTRFTGLAQFEGGEGLPGAVFKEVSSFEHARFEHDAQFDDTLFQNKAGFREASFQAVYFSPNGQAQSEEQFQGPVNLSGCIYKRIQTNWRSLLKHLQPYDRQPYTQLEKVLRAAGQDDKADDVYLERRRIERNRLSFQRDFFPWVGDFLYKYLANYGVRPYRLLITPLLLLALSTFFFSRPGAVRLKPGPNSAQSAIPETGDKSTGFTLGDSARLSIRYFLPVEVPLATHWEASDKQYGPLRFSDYATGMKLAGWILVPLGIAALTGLLRRVTP